jgi:hypothetical protein
MSGVVELNFGPGLFDANGKDLIMEVPLEGRLGHFFPKGYSEASEAHSQLSHYLDLLSLNRTYSFMDCIRQIGRFLQYVLVYQTRIQIANLIWL